MSLPHAHTVRPDTGMTNARLGMGLFLAADAMFFGALFSSYAFLRTAAGYWPAGREVLPVGLNALSLATATAGCAMALAAWVASAQRPGKARLRLVWSAGWGLLSLLLAAASWHQTLQQAGPPSANTFLAIYYVLTAAVTLHVLCASILSIIVAATSGLESNAVRTSRMGSAGLTWSFTWLMAMACFCVFQVL